MQNSFCQPFSIDASIASSREEETACDAVCHRNFLLPAMSLQRIIIVDSFGNFAVLIILEIDP
jgi:hypothetical protein